MRFLVDECTGPMVAHWLQRQGHEVFSVYEESRGMDDRAILSKSHSENWILITNDKDFGERVNREKQLPHGVVLLRLHDERSTSKIGSLQRLLVSHADQLADAFVVVTESQIRFGRT